MNQDAAAMTAAPVVSPAETLLALAERCEKAARPTRAIQHALLEALGWRREELEHGSRWYRPDGERERGPLPNPSASIDAALTLVPEGASWCVAFDPADKHKYAASVTVHGDGTTLEPVLLGPGQSAALALCAAALRARAPAAQPPTPDPTSP